MLIVLWLVGGRFQRCQTLELRPGETTLTQVADHLAQFVSRVRAPRVARSAPALGGASW